MNLENILLPARTGDRRLPLPMARMWHAQSGQNVEGQRPLVVVLGPRGARVLGAGGPSFPCYY